MMYVPYFNKPKPRSELIYLSFFRRNKWWCFDDYKRSHRGEYCDCSLIPQDDGSQANDDDTKSTRIYRQPIPPLPSLEDEERKLPRPGNVTFVI